jgi:lysine 2,3-aminomutase
MNEQIAASAVASQSAAVLACEAEEPPSTTHEVGALDAEPPSNATHGSAPFLSPSFLPLAAVSLSDVSLSNVSLANFSPAAVAHPINVARTAAHPQGIRHPHWRDVPDELWEDWRWQRQHAIRTTAQLAELLELPATEIAALEGLESKYRTAIPPYYFSLIDVNDPDDPIRLQSVPSSKEEVNISGVEFDDPLEEDKDSPVPGVTHRYPDRALLITTPVCSMYCRFCTRKRVTMDREGWDAPSRDEERMIEYVRDTKAIRDVIVSGGDPLTLPVAKLRWFVEKLAAIDHVDVIRIGTRVPVTLPQRLFDNELVDLLAGAQKIWIQTHFNHPREITPESGRAIRNLVNAGMPVNNHAVLMKGVNDSVETMRQLVRGLLKIKVRPYYLFHCDPVTGAGHFRTSVWKGIEIIEGLRGHVSGLGVPTYVVDGLHGAGKIPVMPNYMLSASDDAVILRNYEGMIFRYAPEDKPVEAQPIESQGVSRVLSGNGRPIVPADTPRQQRRRKFALEKVQVEEHTFGGQPNGTDAGLAPIDDANKAASTRNGNDAAKPANGKSATQKVPAPKMSAAKLAALRAPAKPVADKPAAAKSANGKLPAAKPTASKLLAGGKTNGNSHPASPVKLPGGKAVVRRAKSLTHRAVAPALKNDVQRRNGKAKR